jgi:tetratricopeptide (TPR) repeat protein
MLANACLQIANADLEKADFSRAIAYYNKTIGLAPTELGAYLGKANACVQLKDFAQAAEVLEKMASLQPENPTVFLSLGDVLYQSGDPVGAKQQWQRALPLLASDDVELRQALDRRLSGNLSPDDFR